MIKIIFPEARTELFSDLRERDVKIWKWDK